MEKVTFEQLPALLVEIRDRLMRIEERLNKLPIAEEKEPEFLTIDQVSDLLNLTKATIYSKVCRNQIPVNKRGKRLYFERIELLNWVKKGRKKTIDEKFINAQEAFKSSFNRR